MARCDGFLDESGATCVCNEGNCLLLKSLKDEHKMLYYCTLIWFFAFKARSSNINMVYKISCTGMDKEGDSIIQLLIRDNIYQ